MEEPKPKKSGDMSDMTHRIKTEEARGRGEPVKSIQRKLAGYERDGRPIYVDVTAVGDNYNGT